MYMERTWVSGEHGSLSYFGAVLRDVKKFTRKSTDGEHVGEGSLESILECHTKVLWKDYSKNS